MNIISNFALMMVLLVGLLAFVAGVVLTWGLGRWRSGRGARAFPPAFLAPWRRKREVRTLAEDVLKLLYKRRVGEADPSVSLLESLGPSRSSRLAWSLDYLQTRGLIAPATFELTERGQARALDVLSRHRLYETFLSERTGLPHDRWHALAERMEHHLDEAAARELARTLGFPRFDPHGDPIPQPDGEVPMLGGLRLDELRAEGGWFRVVRFLTLSREQMRTLRGQGLYLGAVLRFLGVRGGGARFEVGGREVLLPMDLARRVVAQPEDCAPPNGLMLLSELQPGVEAEVYGLTGECTGPNRRRLLDLGFVRGSAVRIDLVSPLHNPIAYLIRGTTIALRRDQAQFVMVQRRGA